MHTVAADALKNETKSCLTLHQGDGGHCVWLHNVVLLSFLHPQASDKEKIDQLQEEILRSQVRFPAQT